MSYSFDVRALLEPVSADAPAGADLEYDPLFGELERAAQGKPEQQFASTIIPAEEPDWKAVVAQGCELLQRTRDLRILAHLAVARLHLAGLPAYAETLQAIRDLLATRWDEVHPQLDPEDGNDPAVRANALGRLASHRLVLQFLRGMTLASEQRAGTFSWRDIAVANGELEAEDGATKPAEADIRAAFEKTDRGRRLALRQAAADAADAARALGDVFEARAGHGKGPDLDKLLEVLTRIARVMDRYDTGAEPATAAPGETDAAAAGTAAPAPPPAAVPAVTSSAVTEITSRAEAVRLLDLVCRYYQRCEPSSPLPLLIGRARRLADKDFLEILRDLAPDGLSQAQVVIGSRDE